MDEKMRRLPPWMLAGASSDVPATSNRRDSKRKHEPEEAPKEKAEKRPRRIVKPKERDDSEKVGIKTRGGERVRSNKIGEEEEAKPSIGDGKNPEIIQSVTGPGDGDLTVDDLLIFAQEYVKGEEDQAIEDREGLSISESREVVDESNMRLSSQGGTRDPTADDMLSLLLGPFFKKT
ncbi:unnamed protein product [Arabis nemorensis]|uniref:Uncharacterized protein n=1 Tax=Arabis nemorensis TaxID=586526 RepID=A0A565B8T6_9BRAS|nr:unnamed protein product [Arabis nemorensis]